ncbi:hypothetical protein BC828DRAFT_383897 [Blastocladiella britannica]|nr:hypothetical protein BC828DRAFT_383897 [Blastocladiella britannica]
MTSYSRVEDDKDTVMFLTAADLAPAPASSGGAVDDQGNINWDCPCLGGMAYGPCGEQFRDAFSCFVSSEEEPKGIDCVEKFQAMQECFREHPEVYADELKDDDADPVVASPSGSAVASSGSEDEEGGEDVVLSSTGVASTA